MNKNYTFTSESVTEGHPDKVCDQISDAILDAILSEDSEARVACETLISTARVVVSAEITTSAEIDYDSIIKKTLTEIGYTKDEFGIEWDPKLGKQVIIETLINEQSKHIKQGVDATENKEQGAGDQGLMFGFACKETPELMPLPIILSHRLAEKLTNVRKSGKFSWLRPDGKTQVTVEYKGTTPVKIANVVLATQHEDMLKKFNNSVNEELEFIRNNMINHVIKPVLNEYNYPYDENFIVNGTGRFVEGGPMADTGLTGRKIIVDTYGGYARHGGGAFSGKDPSKVDRSAAYMTRYIAKNIVAAELAERCEVQLAYSIGVAEPVSVLVETFGTGKLSDESLTSIVKQTFNLKPAGIIQTLDLKRPIYQPLAAYGHLGREGFTWENTDRIDQLKTLAMEETIND